MNFNTKDLEPFIDIDIENKKQSFFIEMLYLIYSGKIKQFKKSIKNNQWYDVSYKYKLNEKEIESLTNDLIEFKKIRLIMEHYSSDINTYYINLFNSDLINHLLISPYSNKKNINYCIKLKLETLFNVNYQDYQINDLILFFNNIFLNKNLNFKIIYKLFKKTKIYKNKNFEHVLKKTYSNLSMNTNLTDNDFCLLMDLILRKNIGIIGKIQDYLDDKKELNYYDILETILTGNINLNKFNYLSNKIEFESLFFDSNIQGTLFRNETVSNEFLNFLIEKFNINTTNFSNFIEPLIFNNKFLEYYLNPKSKIKFNSSNIEFIILFYQNNINIKSNIDYDFNYKLNLAHLIKNKLDINMINILPKYVDINKFINYLQLFKLENTEKDIDFDILNFNINYLMKIKSISLS